MQAIHRHLAERGCTAVRCQVDGSGPNSAPFWLALGYLQVRDVVDDAGRDVVIMERSLG